MCTFVTVECDGSLAVSGSVVNVLHWASARPLLALKEHPEQFLCRGPINAAHCDHVP